MKEVQIIDAEKRKIEAVFIPPLRRTFNHMAADAKALYLATKKINAKALALNYRPEFLTIIRQAQRDTIAKFGFSIRQQGEKKGFCFKIAKYIGLIKYQIDTKDVDVILEPTQEEKVNQEFALASTLFVANSTEEQADYITDTNEKEISDAEKMSVILFFNTQKELTNNIYNIKNEITQLELERMVGGSESILDAKKKKLEDKLKKLELELEELNKNKDLFIANEIQKKIIRDGVSRSELIASQNVGMAESWARQKEAELVDDNIPEMEMKKKWSAILDSHTRATHVIADGQTVAINDNFIVGGYPAKTPRAENLPIQETANCRCVAVYISE